MKRRTRALLWLAAITPFLLLAAWHWSDGPGLDAGDYAHYLLHARALVEGRSYTDTGYIFSKYAWGVGPPAQPPGLPLTLWPIVALFGSQLWAIKPVMLAFAASFLLLAGRYFAKHEQLALGLGVALLAGLSPDIVRTATQVSSDLPFAALLWIVIYLFDRPGEWSYGRIAGIAAVGGLAMLYRVVGIVLIPAALIFGLIRFREHRFKALVPFGTWTALSVLALLMIPAVSDALGRVSLEAITTSLTRPWEMFYHRLQNYRLGLFESHLYPLPWNAANDVFHLVSVILMVVGLVAWLSRARKRFLLCFAVLYTGALLAVPVADARYLWPLFPLSVFGLLNGVAVICRAARGSWVAAKARAISLAVALALAVLAITIGPKEPRRVSLAEQPDVRELFAWLQERAKQEPMRVVFVKPRVLTWETRIPAMSLFVVPFIERETAPGCAPSRLAYLEHLRDQEITHVVDGDYGIAPPLQRVLARVVEECSDSFTLQFRNGSFRVYRFQGMGGVGS